MASNTSVSSSTPATSASSSISTSTSDAEPEPYLPNTFPGGRRSFLPPTSYYNRFQNAYHMITGGMSPRGQIAYWTDRDKRNEVGDCRRCEANRDYLLEYSPIIRFMTQNLAQLGGTLDKNNIRCRRCEYHERMEGGLDPKYGIKLCANVVEERSRMEDVLAHEMIHAWDHLRWKVDWHAKDGDLRGVACSEVRIYSILPVIYFNCGVIFLPVSSFLLVDPCLVPQWRMPFRQRVLPQPHFPAFPTAPGLRASSCRPVRA